MKTIWPTTRHGTYYHAVTSSSPWLVRWTGFSLSEVVKNCPPRHILAWYCKLVLLTPPFTLMFSTFEPCSVLDPNTVPDESSAKLVPFRECCIEFSFHEMRIWYAGNFILLLLRNSCYHLSKHFVLESAVHTCIKAVKSTPRPTCCTKQGFLCTMPIAHVHVYYSL